MTTFETNILRALTAYRAEKGASPDAAAAWAEANLQEGITTWGEARAKIPSPDRESDGDAYDALKIWAQAQA
jgi:hypothetical protein